MLIEEEYEKENIHGKKIHCDTGFDRGAFDCGMSPATATIFLVGGRNFLRLKVVGLTIPGKGVMRNVVEASRL
jgi:hypothetical protein